MADKITHDMTYVGFGDEKLPGQLKYATDAKWDADQPVAQADDWEYLQQGPYVLEAKPGTFADGKKVLTEGRFISTKFLRKRFPDCGPGRELVVGRVRRRPTRSGSSWRSSRRTARSGERSLS